MLVITEIIKYSALIMVTVSFTNWFLEWIWVDTLSFAYKSFYDMKFT